jgi:hypothetical protein
MNRLFIACIIFLHFVLFAGENTEFFNFSIDNLSADENRELNNILSQKYAMRFNNDTSAYFGECIDATKVFFKLNSSDTQVNDAVRNIENSVINALEAELKKDQFPENENDTWLLSITDDVLNNVAKKVVLQIVKGNLFKINLLVRNIVIKKVLINEKIEDKLLQKLFINNDGRRTTLSSRIVLFALFLQLIKLCFNKKSEENTVLFNTNLDLFKEYNRVFFSGNMHNVLQKIRFRRKLPCGENFLFDFCDKMSNGEVEEGFIDAQFVININQAVDETAVIPYFDAAISYAPLFAKLSLLGLLGILLKKIGFFSKIRSKF